MREVPECLNRRYKAVDDLIQQLSWSVRSSDSPEPNRNESADPGIKLMCDFWDILKEDPNCDLKKQVKQRMGLSTPSTQTIYPQEVACYNVADKEQPKWKACAQKLRNFCSQKPSRSGSEKANSSHCKAVNGHCQLDYYHSKQTESPVPKTPQSEGGCVDHPLNKALCGVNNAATFESQCNSKLNDLIVTQLRLVQQIEVLETREQDGLKLLKKADCMWSSMEDSYKKRLQQYTERQEDLLQQMREFDTSNTKWRKNKKDLENQIANTKKKIQGIDDQIAQKKTDQKLLKMEIEDYTKRIETTKTEINNAKKYLETRKQTSEKKVANCMSEVTRLQQLLEDEKNNKLKKEKSGNSFVKEARQELQKICRVLLRKRLENEDRRAEKAALLEEIDLLNITMDQCKNRCKLKQDTLNEDVVKLDQQIANYKMKCIQCNQCTDSNDVRRFCVDCPRCNEDSDCVYEDGYCYQDSSNACICMYVKEKFLDNVFDNMYTVLERHSKNAHGKHVAESIMNCLKHSKNGKLNTETKKQLQDFILSTLRRNLNLTIVGGAVKTRCELEPETYNKLMLCLKSVTPEKVPKERVDKATEKKDPCKHWHGRVMECHCPYGPKDCVCSKKAPAQPEPPKPAPEKKPPEEAVKPGEVLKCPHKAETVACGPDCNAFDALMKVGTEMATWRPDPCSGPACSFNNVRAVQCILGPEVLNKALLDRTAATRSLLPIYARGNLDNEIKTSCSKSCLTKAVDPKKSYPRERIIEEVMGRYIEVSPIQKVTTGKESPIRRTFESIDLSTANNIRHFDEGCNSPKTNIIQTVEKSCDVKTTINNKLVKKYNDRLTADNYKKLEAKTAKTDLLGGSSQTIVLKDTAELEKFKKERKSLFGKRHVDWDDTHGQVVRISPDPKLKVDTKTESSFIVILDSKFYAPNCKTRASSFTSFYSDFDLSSYEGASVASSNDEGSSVEFLVRNIDICNVAEDLIKEVIVSESRAKNYWGPETEWMTISSFISQLSRRSKNSISNLSNEEVELSNITLEATKSSNKEKNNNSFIRNLLNDLILENVKENLIKELNTYNQGSQYTYSEITKQLDTANSLRESKNTLLSSSTSGPSIKITESHSRCCKYFMQSMINQASDMFKKSNMFDPSMNCFRKFVKTTFRKPVHVFEYKSANITSNSTSSNSTSTK